MATEQYYCEKCNKTMDAGQFYLSNNIEKYPNKGRFPYCKKCMTMHVDNWDPNTYLWILQEADVPYVPEEWNKLMATYAKDRAKVTGMTIVGRYLSKMRLKQWAQLLEGNSADPLERYLVLTRAVAEKKRRGYERTGV